MDINRSTEGFLFSQGSLQDFVDCRRRFQLRYLKRLAWPAVESEPVLEAERFQQRGTLFHRLAQQRLVGVPEEQLGRMVGDDELLGWWRNFLEFHQQLSGDFHVEISLSAALGSARLAGKYDLIVFRGGKATIYDWKTSRQMPRRLWLAERLQTRLYPYLLVRSGAALNGGQPIAPEAVEMVYWFTNFPTQPERFTYSAQAYRDDEAYLSDLIATIGRLGEQDFPLTTDTRRCAYCVYRSLCERGVRAGEMQADDEEGGLDFTLDFEQVAEIEF